MDESCQRPYSDDRREEQARARAEYNRPVPPTRKYSEELAPDDPPDILTDRLKEYMETLKSFRSDAMDEIYLRNQSWEWNYGRTPDFAITVHRGMVDSASIRVEKGCISSSDGLSVLDNVPFSRADLETILLEGGLDGTVRKLIAALSRLTV